MSLHLNSAIISLAVLDLAMSAAAQSYLHAPSVNTYATHDPSGLTILSNGRYIKPAGRHLPVGRFPYGLAMSRDGATLFVANDGVGQVITNWQRATPGVATINPPAYQRSEGRRGKPTNAGGADFSPGRELKKVVPSTRFSR